MEKNKLYILVFQDIVFYQAILCVKLKLITSHCFYPNYLVQKFSTTLTMVWVGAFIFCVAIFFVIVLVNPKKRKLENSNGNYIFYPPKKKLFARHILVVATSDLDGHWREIVPPDVYLGEAGVFDMLMAIAVSILRTIINGIL